ncbi:peptide deformylase [Pelagibaculum spongiae]|uniref:Peptide deformylase n=1 Tax=Pelagibaculum spongiae TaxID=2080658 RepID=A0A2V1H644_9GAMM|nr:peptide deformylase [Pelagibaculum spongiae]PVZ71892.1 peptide deformylase [Pelagibaculum spongiae]
MAVRRILRMGDPLLRRQAREVEDPTSADIKLLIQDMLDTMRHYDGAGLAAPQIGIDLQLVIFGFEHNPRYPDQPAIPQTILINPMITPTSQEKFEDWEGCLSLPGIRGQVPRFHQIHYYGLDKNGNKVENEVSGFHARVIQHECDHLEGRLFPDRMTSLETLGFEEELFQQNQT